MRSSLIVGIDAVMSGSGWKPHSGRMLKLVFMLSIRTNLVSPVGRGSSEAAGKLT